jgi:hypothetical protein
VVVTLENWHVMGPVMIKTLDEAIARRLEDEGLSADLAKEMPYSIWSIADLEDGFQLFDTVPISTFMDGKLGVLKCGNGNGGRT